MKNHKALTDCRKQNKKNRVCEMIEMYVLGLPYGYVIIHSFKFNESIQMETLSVARKKKPFYWSTIHVQNTLKCNISF